MALVFIGCEPMGCRNLYKTSEKTEYDSNYRFCVMLGIPVWFSIRKCVHVTERMGGFDYIQLRPRLGLKLMMPFYWIVWLIGILALCGALMYLVPKKPGVAPPDPSKDSLVLACTIAMPLFIPALALYLHMRRPSARQRLIREIVGRETGIHSDLAEWALEPAREIARSLGYQGQSGSEILGTAQKLADKGELADALIAARLCVAFLNPSQDAPQVELAEALTVQLLESAKEISYGTS